jgi:hypothetical protein
MVVFREGPGKKKIGTVSILMGDLREGPGKAKEGTVSVLEKGRKEEKRIRESYKKLQASMRLHWGSCRPHRDLRGDQSRSLRGLIGTPL